MIGQAVSRRAAWLIGLSLLALLTAEERSRVVLPVLLAFGAWQLQRWGLGFPEWSWKILSVAALGAFLVSTFGFSGSPLFGSVHLLLYLLVNKAHHLTGPRDYQQLLLIAFLTLLASSILAVSLSLAVVIIVFLGVAASLLALLHQYREFGAEGSPSRIGSRTLWTQGFAVLVMTAALFFALPRVGVGTLQSNFVRPQHVSGFSAEVGLDDIGQIKENDARVARVRPLQDPIGDPTRFLRMLAFGRFDGERWQRYEGRQRLLGDGLDDHPFSIARSADDSAERRYEITVEPLSPAILPLPVKTVELRAAIAGLVVDEGGAIGLASWSPRRHQRLTYEVSVVDERLPPSSAVAQGLEVADETSVFTQTPPLHQDIVRLAETWIPGTGDRIVAARGVESRLRANYAYTLDLAPAANPVHDFLFERRAGHCELFASAMTLLLRSRGIPARVVNGFRLSEWSDIGGYWLIRQSDAHAWVEVETALAGWVAFDPTPPDPVRSRWTMGLRGVSHAVDVISFAWDRYVISWSGEDQRQIATDVAEGFAEVLALLRETVSLWLGIAVMGFGLTIGALRWQRQPRRPAEIEIYLALRKLLGIGDSTVGPGAVLACHRERPGVSEVIESYVRIRYAGERASGEHIARMRRGLAQAKRARGFLVLESGRCGSHGCRSGTESR